MPSAFRRHTGSRRRRACHGDIVWHVSVLAEALRRWRLSGADLPARVEKGHVAGERRNRQTLRHREKVRRIAEAMDRRASQLGAMPQAREGALGKLQSESARVPAPRLDPAHVEKAMQSRELYG